MGIQGSIPPVSSVQDPDPTPPQTGNSVGRLFSNIKGKAGGFLSLPDKHPKLRIAFDIGIIALAVISIISIIMMSGGQGLMLYALIPGMLFAGMGVALLISDVVKNPKTMLRAQKVMALITPLLLASAAALLIIAASAVGGPGVMMVAQPQFILGLVLASFSLLSVARVTIPVFQSKRPVNIGSKRTKTLTKVKHAEGGQISKSEKKRKQDLDAKTKEAFHRMRHSSDKQESTDVLTHSSETSEHSFSSPLNSSSSTVWEPVSPTQRVKGKPGEIIVEKQTTVTPPPSAENSTPVFSTISQIQPQASATPEGQKDGVKPVKQSSKSKSSQDDEQNRDEQKQNEEDKKEDRKQKPKKR